MHGGQSCACEKHSQVGVTAISAVGAGGPASALRAESTPPAPGTALAILSNDLLKIGPSDPATGAHAPLAGSTVRVAARGALPCNAASRDSTLRNAPRPFA